MKINRYIYKFIDVSADCAPDQDHLSNRSASA